MGQGDEGNIFVDAVGEFGHIDLTVFVVANNIDDDSSAFYRSKEADRVGAICGVCRDDALASFHGHGPEAGVPGGSRVLESSQFGVFCPDE